MSIAQSFKNRQITQRKYSVKILSPIPESYYFPYFFENIAKTIPYENTEYSIILKNKQNLKQISNEESQRVKSEIDEISQLYKKFEMEIPPIIQKGLLDVSQIFDKKNEKSHATHLCKFMPFSNQSSLQNSEEAKAVLLRFFDVEAANNLNKTQIKKINEYDSEKVTSTTKLAKEGVYIPPALTFDIGTLMLQTFVEAYDDDADNNNDKPLISENTIFLDAEHFSPRTKQKGKKYKKAKSTKDYKSKKKKKYNKSKKNSNEENDQLSILDGSEIKNNENDVENSNPFHDISSLEIPNNNPINNDEAADDEEMQNDSNIFYESKKVQDGPENNEQEEDENKIQDGPVNNEQQENENKIQDGPENNEILEKDEHQKQEIQNQLIEIGNDQIAIENGENDQINNEDPHLNENNHEEEDLSDPFEIPYCDEALPDETYMNCSYTEKLIFELESLGFTLPSNRNILVANAFCVVNGIDPKEIDQKVERANKAKEFLHDFTIDHLPQIEEHNQRVAMGEFLNQSLSPA